MASGAKTDLTQLRRALEQLVAGDIVGGDEARPLGTLHRRPASDLGENLEGFRDAIPKKVTGQPSRFEHVLQRTSISRFSSNALRVTMRAAAVVQRTFGATCLLLIVPAEPRCCSKFPCGFSSRRRHAD